MFRFLGNFKKRIDHKTTRILILVGTGFFLVGCGTIDALGPTTGKNPDILRPTGESLTFSKALAHFSQGLIHEIHRDYEGALTQYREALALDPDNEELYYRIAMGLLNQSKKQEAIEIIEILRKRHPKSRKALLWLALFYRSVGETEQSITTYQRLLKIAPRHPAGYIQLALMYVKKNQEDKAIKLLRKAIDKVDNPLELLKVLGELYVHRASNKEAPSDQSKKDQDAAIWALEMALDNAPLDIPLLYQLGDLYIHSQQLGKAIECFERIETQRPNDLLVKQQLVNSFKRIGDKEQAVEKLEDIAQQHPTNPMVFTYLGELYQQIGDKDRAILNFNLAIKADPEAPSHYLKLALVQVEDNNEKAIQVLKDGLKVIPDEPQLVEMLAYVYLGDKQFKQASHYFGRTQAIIEKASPRSLNPRFFFNYSIASFNAGDTDQAASMLVKAIEGKPAYLDAFFEYSFQKKLSEDIIAAREVLKKVTVVMSEDPVVYNHIGMLSSLPVLKDYQGAHDAFAKAKDLLEWYPEKLGEWGDSFYFWYGASAERLGQIEKAEELFRKCLELNEEYADAYNYLAYMWAENNMKLEEGFVMVQKALDLAEKQKRSRGAYVDTLGWIYYMQGEYEKALEQIELAYEEIPQDPTIIDHLGDVLEKLDRLDESIRQWKKAFVLSPDDKKLAERLEKKLLAHDVDLEPLKEEALALKEAQEALEKQAEKDAEAALRPSPLEEQIVPAVESSPEPAPDKKSPEQEIFPAPEDVREPVETPEESPIH